MYVKNKDNKISNNLEFEIAILIFPQFNFKQYYNLYEYF